MRHEFDVVSTFEQLAANAKAWGIVDAAAGSATSDRYVTYRALQLSYVLEQDERQPMRCPPPNAAYFAWRIFYGHSFEAVISGGSSEFDIGVRASLLDGKFGMGIQEVATDLNLTAEFHGRGLRPASGQAIFARTLDEVGRRYSNYGDAVPILIEYRLIPGRRPLEGNISWATPDPSRYNYRLSFTISAAGCDELNACDLSASVSVGGTVIDHEAFQKNRNRVSWTLNRPVTGKQLGAGLQLNIWDRDVGTANDTIGRCTISRTPSELLSTPNGRPARIPCGSPYVYMTITRIE